MKELRMDVNDGTTATTNLIFDKIVKLVENACAVGEGWELDSDNLEGVRVRIGQGGFFMLRKSLHDPIISLQIEGSSTDSVSEKVVGPLLDLLETNDITSALDVGCLTEY